MLEGNYPGLATHDPENGQVTLFAVNRSTSGPLHLDADLTAFAGLGLVEALTFTSEDPLWHATEQDSTSVLPAQLDGTAFVGGRLTADLPPVSWTMIRLG